MVLPLPAAFAGYEMLMRMGRGALPVAYVVLSAKVVLYRRE